MAILASGIVRGVQLFDFRIDFLRIVGHVYDSILNFLYRSCINQMHRLSAALSLFVARPRVANISSLNDTDQSPEP